MNRVVIRAKDGDIKVNGEMLESGHGREVELEPGAAILITGEERAYIGAGPGTADDPTAGDPSVSFDRARNLLTISGVTLSFDAFMAIAAASGELHVIERDQDGVVRVYRPLPPADEPLTGDGTVLHNESVPAGEGQMVGERPADDTAQDAAATVGADGQNGDAATDAEASEAAQGHVAHG